MGFEDKGEKKNRAQKHPGEMTLHELNVTLDSFAEISRFNAHGASERNSNNYLHIAKWAGKSVEQFREDMLAARKEKRDIRVVSGAITPDGACRMPVDDFGNFLTPLLDEIITMQQERIARVDYAKDMSAKEWDRSNLARKLSTG